jgi:hypothetical protein
MNEAYTLSTKQPNFAESTILDISSEPTTCAAVRAVEQSVFQATKQEKNPGSPPSMSFSAAARCAVRGDLLPTNRG